MSINQNNNEDEDTITYVFIPDDEIYGIVKNHGLYASVIEYYEGGIQYNIEVPNEDFIIVDEIGITYIDETEENL